MHNDFLSRMEDLSVKRDMSPWLISLGFSSGLATNIQKGASPGADLLEALERQERVSLRWLLEGRGPMYHVRRCIEPKEALYELANLLEERDAVWTVYRVISRSESRYCLVLVMGDQYYRKIRGQDEPKTINYDRVEVLSGHLGPDCMRLLYKAMRYTVGNLYETEVTRLKLYQIDTGMLGNMALLGWQDARKHDDGLLISEYSELSVPDDYEHQQIHSPPVDTITDEPSNVHQLYTLKTISDPEAEETVLSHFRHLDGEGRKAVLLILRAMDPYFSGE